MRDLLAAAVMILALAGRRIDGNDAKEVRFPLRNVGYVSRAMEAFLSQNRVTVVVASAACGADLIALSEAGKLGLRRRVVLPFSRERFRVESVTDRPGDWGRLYDMILDDVDALGDLVIMAEQVGDDPFAMANRVILDEAMALGRTKGEEVGAALIWDGRRNGEQDYTAEFGAEARERDVRVLELNTLQPYAGA